LIVVVNGQEFDRGLLWQLASRTDLKVVQLPQASFAQALLAGRQVVSAPFFSFLDDDDEYLPGAVDKRRKVLLSNPDADVAASNGLRRSEGSDSLALRNLTNVSRDPIQALFVENWLPSCGGTFRTSTVPIEAFENLPRHIQWTLLGYLLVLGGKKLVTLDEPTFVINDTPGSASKSEAYLLCHVDVYERMLCADPPLVVRATVERRLASALHEASDHYRQQRRSGEAWAAHLRSLRCSGGWKYLPYTRHLLSLR
jgi:hypothetical protein